jgi:hypothetical protein
VQQKKGDLGACSRRNDGHKKSCPQFLRRHLFRMQSRRDKKATWYWVGPLRVGGTREEILLCHHNFLKYYMYTLKLLKFKIKDKGREFWRF